MSTPPHIWVRHLSEWNKSAIAPEITSLNLVSLSEQAPYGYLFYSDSIKRLNTGRLPTWILKKYSHIKLQRRGEQKA